MTATGTGGGTCERRPIRPLQRLPPWTWHTVSTSRCPAVDLPATMGQGRAFLRSLLEGRFLGSDRDREGDCIPPKDGCNIFSPGGTSATQKNESWFAPDGTVASLHGNEPRHAATRLSSDGAFPDQEERPSRRGGGRPGRLRASRAGRRNDQGSRKRPIRMPATSAAAAMPAVSSRPGHGDGGSSIHGRG